MTYTLSSIARNTGKDRLKVAKASRRACCTAACSEAGRIGINSETASSEAINSAITRSIFSPRFLGMTDSNACVVTLQRTSRASGAGISSVEIGREKSIRNTATYRPDIHRRTVGVCGQADFTVNVRQSRPFAAGLRQIVTPKRGG